MRFGPRRPNLKRRLAARTSWKRYARHSLGIKASRGMGWLTNPRKAAYNRAYNTATFNLFKPRGRRRVITSSSPLLATAVIAAVFLWLLGVFG